MQSVAFSRLRHTHPEARSQWAAHLEATGRERANSHSTDTAQSLAGRGRATSFGSVHTATALGHFGATADSGLGLGEIGGGFASAND